jgi:hypothetical protein
MTLRGLWATIRIRRSARSALGLRELHVCRMVQRSALVFQSRARLERILTALPANLGHNAMERGARNEMRGAGNERALGPLSSNVQITAVPFAQARRRTAASAAVPAMGRSQPT